MALVPQFKKHVPWIAAALGAVLALNRDCTLNAYASASSVQKLETRVNTLEDRLISADAVLARRLDDIYQLLLEHHDTTSPEKYCR